jgi:DNA processing protein
MTDDDLLYQIALTMAENIGDIRAKTLIGVYGDAASVFKAPARQLARVDGIGSLAAEGIKSFADFKTCEEEIDFINRYNIRPLFFTDPGYPRRLLNCYDSPSLLYYKGTADLNADRVVSIVGTRSNSDYGRTACEKIIEELRGENILIASGLAYGIDSISHRAALENKLSTVAVVAHGLDRIYPPVNKQLAKEMMVNGGILTDFRSSTNPDRQNFPRRNRIVAGICDALIVIESNFKGGSLITAEIANSYNKDIFAVPGRISDTRSAGCNYLVKANKASLITDAQDLLKMMNWKQQKPLERKQQRELFVTLTDNERIITNMLATIDMMRIDELFSRCNLSSGNMAEALLMLEMQGIIQALPGKCYRLL